MRERRDRGGVAHVPRPVRDVAQQHERGAVGEDLRHLRRGHAAVVLGRDPPQRRAVLARDALQHVPVRREVPGVEHDLVAARDLRRRERGAHELVEDHRRRVPDERLAGRRAERHRADPVAQRQRQLVPLLVPAADEPRAPDVGREPREPLGRRARRPAERVPVEVGGDLLGVDERVTEPRERVRRVERGRPRGVVGAGGRGVGRRSCRSSPVLRGAGARGAPWGSGRATTTARANHAATSSGSSRSGGSPGTQVAAPSGSGTAPSWAIAPRSACGSRPASASARSSRALTPGGGDRCRGRCHRRPTRRARRTVGRCRSRRPARPSGSPPVHVERAHPAHPAHPRPAEHEVTVAIRLISPVTPCSTGWKGVLGGAGAGHRRQEVIGQALAVRGVRQPVDARLERAGRHAAPLHVRDDVPARAWAWPTSAASVASSGTGPASACRATLRNDAPAATWRSTAATAASGEPASSTDPAGAHDRSAG